jgi:beta-phosphoglucomutase
MTLEAMIFDLDGTLVQTEKLKALSYTQAVRDLCSSQVADEEVVEAYKEVVGLPRERVAQALLEKFGLGSAAADKVAQFGVHAPWQAFLQLRLMHYETILADRELIVENQWPHTVDLLKLARAKGCKIGMATMSRCAQATRILDIIDLKQAFDFVASRDDVEAGKPDPEIYLLVARVLGVDPTKCLVIEDSPAGVAAALAAGMQCIAVTTPFTRESIQASELLDERWIVNHPDDLIPVVSQKMEIQ